MLKPKQEKAPEFLVMDKFGNFFAGFKGGELHWSHNISDARELTEPNHYVSICRWENWREPKAEYL
jgi:hypothetical protein